MIAGDALAAACSDPDVLARLGGPLGDAARAKAAALRALPEPQRKPARALAAALARAPAPTGLRGIHASWIEAALAGLPARARGDLARGGMEPAGAARADFDPVAVWLARWAGAALAPMPDADATCVRPPAPPDVARMTGDAIAAWLAEVGADQLAFALGAAATGMVAAQLAAARARIERAPRTGQLGERRAAIARSRLALDDDGLARIGARAIAPHLDAVARRQLVLRLPRPRGQAILFELVRWREQPLASAPTWAAITAP